MFISRIFEGQPLPDNATVVQLLSTEDVPWGEGTNTRRCYTVILRDDRFWMSDQEKMNQPL